MNKNKIQNLIKELEIAKEELDLLNMKIEELLEQLKAELNNSTQESRGTINPQILGPIRTPILNPVLFPNLQKLLKTEVTRTHLELSKNGLIQVNNIVDKTNSKSKINSYGARRCGKKGSFR